MELLLELKDISFNDIVKNEKVRIEWLDKLNKSMVLQPNFFGLGININNIINKFNKRT